MEIQPIFICKFSPLNRSPHVSIQPHSKNSIICARNNKRRSNSRRSIKFMVQSICFVASKLNILPAPLDLVIREFGFGNGGGGGPGFPKGFGWGGFDGWRRKRKQNLGIWGFAVLCAWLIFAEKIDINLFCFSLILLLVGVNSSAKERFLGLCFCAAVAGFGLKREDLYRWATTTTTTTGFRGLEIARRRRGRR